MAVWTIALAAGAGARLSSVTGAVPKQFWRLRSGLTLLEETLLRLRPLAPAARTVVVAGTEHRPYVEGDGRSDLLRDVHVVLQPRARGTAAGVALGLIPVLDDSPDAFVVISPSDHGVRDEHAYHQGLAAALDHVDRTDDVVLCSVNATRPAQDYGWIVPGAPRGSNQIRSIVTFSEKPEASLAVALYRIGGLWNTMVTVARARTLLALYRQYHPELASVFIQALRVPAAARERWLADAYDTLEPVDFSRDLMTAARGLSTAVWPGTMGWSDLGTPERLRQWESGVEPGEAVGRHEPAHRPAPDVANRVVSAAPRSNPRGSVRPARSVA
jgi:mannose-1-phosphate guanylyltransferase